MLVVHAHNHSDEDASFVQPETINKPTEQKVFPVVRLEECCSCIENIFCYDWWLDTMLITLEDARSTL